MFHRVHAAPGVLGKAHDDGEAPIAFDDRADFLTGQGDGDGAVYISRLKVVTAQRVAVGFDFQQRRATERVELHIAVRGKLSQQVTSFRGDAFEFGEIVAVNFHCNVGPHPGHHFVEAHLNGLHEEIRLAGRVDSELAPLVAQFELDIRVTQIRSHRVNGDFRRANQAENAFDLGKFFQQQLLGLLLQVSGNVQPGAAAADEMDQHGTLVQLGNELRAQPREDEQ